MPHYYFIDSNGENTNLQLYTLKQAKLYWANLERDLSENREVDYLHERCVFIICTIGLSVSQLLGQNNPEPSNQVPSPPIIFNSLVDKHGLDQSLKKKFQDFIKAYDHCRHFGLTIDGDRHLEVFKLSLENTRSIYDFGLFVWNIVIDAFRRDADSELNDLDLQRIEYEP